MSHDTQDTGFRIEWDMHELGEKPATAGPLPARFTPDREFARALATGSIPANAPQIAEDEAA